MFNENLFNLVNWCNFMELWISKCNSNRGRCCSYIIIIFKHWIKKVFKIVINLMKNKYSENKKLISF